MPPSLCRNLKASPLFLVIVSFHFYIFFVLRRKKGKSTFFVPNFFNKVLILGREAIETVQLKKILLNSSAYMFQKSTLSYLWYIKKKIELFIFESIHLFELKIIEVWYGMNINVLNQVLKWKNKIRNSGIEKYFANVLFLSIILIAAHNPSH